ncbi:MAG: molybdopterin oxidoreductase family protein, partial [Alphaproteobacteria bacterium]
WRGEDGKSQGRGAVNPKQLEAYIDNQCFWQQPLPLKHQFFKHGNQGYLQHAQEMGWIPEARPIVLQLYCEPLQRFRLAAQGHGEVQPPAESRERVAKYFDPLPFWYAPFEESLIDEEAFPLHALTQRPMAMYHSWGSQNAWLRQIHGWNKLYMNRKTAALLGIADDDWVWIESHHGRVKGQVKCMEGCNENTVWTWNAIGKRRGAWNLDKDANEGTKGFLLNHTISDLLPNKKGMRLSNSDPVTGQAAWFDLRVRVTKAEAGEAGESAPQFPVLQGVPGLAKRPTRLRFSGGKR